MSGILELCFLFVILGARGFTRAGLPLSSTARLSSARGLVVGAACLALGLGGMAFVYVASDAAGRERLALVGHGAVIGLLGALLLVVPRDPERDPGE